MCRRREGVVPGGLTIVAAQAFARHTPRRHEQSVITVITLMVAIAGPPALVLLARSFFGGPSSLGIALALQFVYGGFAVLVLWTVRRKEQLPLSSIGIRVPRWSTLITGVGLWLVVFVVLPPLMRPLYEWAGADPAAGVQALLAQPLWFRLVQALMGGVVEELLYRGYTLERLITLTGRRTTAVVVATLAFGLAHVPAWGVRYALVADLPFGLIASLVYVWRRDLVANALAHDAGLIMGVLSISA
jgi:membrane protease YdiL (CAAX protease family)